MKKTSFALSWGRKMIFGMGWALTSIVALNYFQSMIFPQNFSGWVYFITTFIGHYGLLVSLLYFLLYCPVVLLFPTYYVSRIWTVLLLLSANLFIFIDSYVFSKYRFHLNSFIGQLMRDHFEAFDFTPLKLSVIILVILAAFVTLWIRGEFLWRSMQARFSNPVKNWYLVLIVMCLGISHSMHMYGDANKQLSLTRLANLFPMHFPLTGKTLLREQGFLEEVPAETKLGYKDFYYPANKLNCSTKDPKNILMIVLPHWAPADLNETVMPHVSHLKQHATVYENHFSGSTQARDGLFSLFYSLPPVYTSSVLHARQEPVFLSHMLESKFDVDFYSTDGSAALKPFLTQHVNQITSIAQHLAERDEMASVVPFFMYVQLNETQLADNDRHVGEILKSFYQHELNSNTIMIITGASGSQHVAEADKLKTPLLMVWPGQKASVVHKLSSHYDIVPTLLSSDWKCKNKVSDYSFGQDLFSSKERFQHVAGTYQHLNIVDLENLSLVKIGKLSGLEVNHLSTMTPAPEKLKADVVLDWLEKITLFYRNR